MLCRWIKIALWYICDYWRDQGVTQFRGYLLRQCRRPDIVLTKSHRGTALFGSANRDDNGRYLPGHAVAQFDPSQVLQDDRCWRRRKNGRRACCRQAERKGDGN